MDVGIDKITSDQFMLIDEITTEQFMLIWI